MKEAAKTDGLSVTMPVVGEVRAPPLEHVVWYLGVAVLTAVELVEWPIALLLTGAKILADNRHSKVLASLGEALEEV